MSMSIADCVYHAQRDLDVGIQQADAGGVEQRVPEAHRTAAQVGRYFVKGRAPLNGGVVTSQTVDFAMESLLELAVIRDLTNIRRIALPDFERALA